MISGSSTDRILLDAHALIWWLEDDQRLSSVAYETIATAPQGDVGAGTVAEMAIKASVGKLRLPSDWTERSQSVGFRLLHFGWQHAEQLSRLPFPSVAGREHRDPFDRMLVAQSLTEDVPVVTRDPAFAAYGCEVIW